MKRNRLTYALPLACLLAAGSSSIALAAGDSSDTSSGSGYSSGSGSGSMNADPTTDRSGTYGSSPSRSSSDRSSTGQAMSDAAITTKVKSALLSERGLPSSQIKVQTNDGIVQLSGFLNSQAEIDRAVEVASNVKDVKSVENNLQTK